MKQTIHTLLNTSVICCLAILVLTFATSCDPTKNVTNNNNNPSHLDPVVGKNTDTSRIGKYNPITDAGKDSNKVVQIDTLYWCDTVQQTIFESVVICYQKIGDRAVTSDTVSVIKTSENDYFIATKIDSTIKRKLAYKVAIIMPFMSQNFVPNPNKEISSRSIKAVEFYEGVLIALDSLKKEGVSLFVDVFDSQRDTAVVQALLQKQELMNADLIIGPITSNNLKLVAEFAKEYEKPMVSPFNSRSDLTTDNPYYIQLNPSYDVHSDYIVNYVHKIESDPKFFRTPLEKHMLVLALEEDSSRVEKIQASYAVYKNSLEAKIPQLIRSNPTIDVENIKPLLDRSKLNIVIVPSYKNEGFIYNSLREIQKLVDKVEPRKGYQIAIVGMDRWKYYNRVNFEYYESMNLHLPSQYHTDPDDKLAEQFKEDYKAVYGIGSREFGFIGYDVMLYFGRMMHKYGVNFQTHLWKEPTQYRHTKFDIQPIYEIIPPLMNVDEQGKKVVRAYENQYLNFLKFEEYKLQKINN